MEMFEFLYQPDPPNFRGYISMNVISDYNCFSFGCVLGFQPKYQCICESGWEASAENPACVADVNECNLPNKPCSTNPAVPCYNTQGSFYCGSCPAGNIIYLSTLTDYLRVLIRCFNAKL